MCDRRIVLEKNLVCALAHRFDAVLIFATAPVLALLMDGALIVSVTAWLTAMAGSGAWCGRHQDWLNYNIFGQEGRCVRQRTESPRQLP
jgi:hypothetical protein